MIDFIKEFIFSIINSVVNCPQVSLCSDQAAIWNNTSPYLGAYMISGFLQRDRGENNGPSRISSYLIPRAVYLDLSFWYFVWKMAWT